MILGQRYNAVFNTNLTKTKITTSKFNTVSMRQLQLSKHFPKRRYYKQAVQILNQYTYALYEQEMRCIIKYINAYFFELILDGLKDDICLQHLVENGAMGEQNAQMFLMSYLFERYDKFISKGVTMNLLTMARPYSKVTLIGRADIIINNYCLYTFVDKDNMLHLDVGISYFLIQFWKRVFEYRSLLGRYFNIVDQDYNNKIKKSRKQQNDVELSKKQLQNCQNTQTLDWNALSISTLNNTLKLSKCNLNQNAQSLDMEPKNNKINLVNKKVQTDPQSSVECIVQEQKEQLKILLSMQDQNTEKIQLQQRQIDFLLNENTLLRQQISENQIKGNIQQQELKFTQCFDNIECSETPSPIGMQQLGKDIDFQHMRDMLKCSQTYD